VNCLEKQLVSINPFKKKVRCLNLSKFEVTKTYEEYIKIFKSVCDELGRTLTTNELKRYAYGLPSNKWFVNHCPDKSVKTYTNFLKWLGYDIKKSISKNKRRKYTYEIAFEEFEKRDLILLPQEYTSSAIPLDYVCPIHSDDVQKKSLNSLLFGSDGNGTGCKHCRDENLTGELHHRWKGGTSPLGAYLREFIKKWKKDSMSKCNYKCVITGKPFDAIHHLYSFNKILQEIFDECNLPIYTVISEYTEEELELIISTNLKIHSRYPLGVCLCKSVHDLYHNLYGDDNTPEQFDEFVNRYNNGELLEVI